MATYPVFSVGEVLTADDMNAVSGWKTGTATGTNTTALTVDGCFSADYLNYRVIFTVYTASISDIVFFMRSGTPPANDGGAVYDLYGFTLTPGAALNGNVQPNRTSGLLTDAFTGSTTQASGAFDLFLPNAASQTIQIGTSWGSNSGNIYYYNHRIETTTAYTGIQIKGSSANISGDVKVYGYRN